LTRVELRYAGLPFIGFLAVHYWFVVEDGAGRHRWEVWQSANAGGESFGHLHRDLKPPEADVGGGPSRVAARWEGEEARRIAEVLSRCSSDYPFCGRYFPWPGPNSNTFVAWVLARAGIRQRLGWRALGGNYGRKTR
jgi:hypothetical protein